MLSSIYKFLDLRPQMWILVYRTTDYVVTFSNYDKNGEQLS